MHQRDHKRRLRAAIAEIEEVTRIQNPTKTSVCPRTRLTPPCGWMGAPMAPVYFNGLYHAYYPFTPYTVTYGILHLGHSTSPDLKKWTPADPILAPSEVYDSDGVYGGSALVHDGRVFVFYTGHREGPFTDPVKGQTVLITQAICLATSEDGYTFRKEGALIHPDDEIRQMLNPKVWRGETGWWMAVAVEFNDEKRRPAIWLYSSHDLTSWAFARELLEARAGDGDLWEMPDFFELDGEQVILLTTRGQQPTETLTDGVLHYTNQNAHQCGAVRGEYSEGGAFIVRKPFTELDHGADFFGAQTFIAKDGRRLLWGWANMPGDKQPTIYYGWVGCSTFIRELSIVNGRIIQQPAREIIGVHDYYEEMLTEYIDNERRYISEDSPAFEFELSIDLDKSSAWTFGIGIGEGFRIEFVRTEDAETGKRELLAHMARSYLQMGLNDVRRFGWEEGRPLVVRGHFDRSVVEIFLEGIDTPFTFRICPELGDRRLALFAIDGVMKFTGGRYWTLRHKEE